MPTLTEFETLVKEMRKWQIKASETMARDDLNMARVYEKKVDEYFNPQQKLI